MASKLKLTVELVPKTAWDQNLREKLGRTAWDKISRTVRAGQGERCALCGVGGRLECHEKWEYDDGEHVQHLRGLVALCGRCHSVKHVGRSRVLAEQGRFDFAALVEHFMAVNSCDRAAFAAHERAAVAEWKLRSRHQWKLDLGKYESVGQ